MSETNKRKRELRKDLILIEKQIYDLETNYLESTKDFGNILVGWDGYLSKDKVRQKKAIFNEERLFSLSSASSFASRREESKSTKKEVNSITGNVVPKGEKKKSKKSLAPKENNDIDPIDVV